MKVLRTVISAADSNNTALFLHFNTPTKDKLKPNAKNLDINKLMQNIGGEQFDYGTFKAAYDTDARVKTMVNNFNQDGIEPKTANTIDSTQQQQDAQGDEVEKMAKNATDLGDSLT